MEKVDKSSEDYYFEKSQKELTFQPKLLSKAKPTSQIPKGPKTKTEQRQMERMRKAREERERVANQFKRGEPKIEKKYEHSNRNMR